MQEELVEMMDPAASARTKGGAIPGIEMMDQPLLRSYGWAGFVYMLLVLGGFFSATAYFLNKLKKSRELEERKGSGGARGGGGGRAKKAVGGKKGQ